MLKRVGQEPNKAKLPGAHWQDRGAEAVSHHGSSIPGAHGVWNIVHVGMLVPQAHQIVCGVNICGAWC